MASVMYYPEKRTKVPKRQMLLACSMCTWREFHTGYENEIEININVSSDPHTSMQTDMKVNTPWNGITHLETTSNLSERNDNMRWECVNWNEILQSIMIIVEKEGKLEKMAMCSLSDVHRMKWYIKHSWIRVSWESCRLEICNATHNLLIAVKEVPVRLHFRKCTLSLASCWS